MNVIWIFNETNNTDFSSNYEVWKFKVNGTNLLGMWKFTLLRLTEYNV